MNCSQNGTVVLKGLRFFCYTWEGEETTTKAIHDMNKKIQKVVRVRTWLLVLMVWFIVRCVVLRWVAVRCSAVRCDRCVALCCVVVFFVFPQTELMLYCCS